MSPLLLFASLMSVSCPADETVSMTTNCSCSHVEEGPLLDLVCPEFEARLQPMEAMAVRCSSVAKQPPQLTLPPWSWPIPPLVRFFDCPPPDISYADLISYDLKVGSNLSIRSSRGALLASHFSGLAELTRLDLSLNNLSSVAELLPELLDELPELRRLDLSHNLLANLSEDVFSSNTSLAELYLDHNLLTELPPQVFSNLTSLYHLDLSHNLLCCTTRFTLAGLANLRTLDLSHNGLQLLSALTFTRLQKLESVDLSYNAIKRLSVLHFTGLKALRSVRMHGNNKLVMEAGEWEWIEGKNRELELANYVFADLPQLTSLTISDSGVDVLPRNLVALSPRLIELGVQGNLISTVPRFMLQGAEVLEVLDLSRNALTELPSDLFSALRSLRELRLGNNMLTELPFSHTAYQHLQVLEVQHNNLTSLPRWVLRQLGSVRSVSLAANPWRCDCELQPLLAWLRAHPRLLADQPRCTHPASKPLLHLSDQDVCPIQYVDMADLL